MSDRLCVASYGEDVSWVAETGMEACVYDATRKREGLIPVPNEAREASQYLRHIVEHYGKFRDYELFLQGNPFDHNPRILQWLSIRNWEGKICYSLGRGTIPCDPSLMLPHAEKLMPFSRDVGLKPAHFRPWSVGAMYAVSRESLESWPLEWWQSLLRKSVVERAWSPWVLERLWTSIFHAHHHV